ncbi:dephospho-CoA kinase [Gordonia hirsuta DSM 44140 = NBRC 16056]|uniref:Dephospho-CoA kinase n=1 Tax=Gordonia hirsuta DSM 44140 = NBRC 16056 TaxID=1121927 RepID=L7L5E2_9ACTN|nr:dephospho-CoA kinase [Gordonia hirsuta DSM 44140 = NBRC 16056]
MGLTGGIGAGKSTVAKTFVAHGAYHIDADRIAREVVEPGTEGLAALVEAFGSEILDDEGALDRAALATRAFADAQSTQKLNSITHPLIGARTAELIAAAPADAVILHDVPLLVEGSLAPLYDAVIVVHTPADLRFDRLVNRRGMDPADARQRIDAQASDEQRRAVADIWLDNSGTPEELAAQALTVWNERIVPLRDHHSAGTSPELPTIPVEVDPAWGAVGARLVNRLWALLGAGAVAIAHVGPTADGASGPPVVPVLDLDVIVADEAAAQAAAEVLSANGFAPLPGESGRVHVAADPGRPARVRILVDQ